MVALFRILEGIALLTLGRKLFWLFVAAIGFEAGAFFVARLMPNQPEWLVIAIALGVGILGAVFALVLQNLVVGMAGFIGGGMIAVRLLDLVNLDSGLFSTVAFVAGGVMGALLVALLFDWALITLSSLGGAVTLTNIFLPRHTLALVVIVILFIVGVTIQAGWFWSEKRRTG
jgi:hypothetical protein